MNNFISLRPSVAHRDLTIDFTTRSDGDMSRTNANRLTVMSKREQVFARNSLHYQDVALMAPTHSPNIEVYERSAIRVSREVWRGQPLISTDFDRYLDGSDGLLTNDPSIPVALVSGDCLPLLLWDEASSLHGIVHIGLLGALNHMTATLAKILDDLKVSSPRFYIGPTISAADYNLTTSGLWNAISHQIEGRTADVYDHITHSGDDRFLDLIGYIKGQLRHEGFDPDSVDVHPSNTGLADDSYFSHHLARGAASTPRFMSVVGFRQ